MSDIVERLRQRRDTETAPNGQVYTIWEDEDALDAADEIIDLRAENGRLRVTLVEAAVPLEALILCMSDPSVKIAPAMQEGIICAVEAIRAALKGEIE